MTQWGHGFYAAGASPRPAVKIMLWSKVRQWEYLSAHPRMNPSAAVNMGHSLYKNIYIKSAVWYNKTKWGCRYMKTLKALKITSILNGIYCLCCVVFAVCLTINQYCSTDAIKAIGVTLIRLFTIGIPNSMEISSPVATRSFAEL